MTRTAFAIAAGVWLLSPGRTSAAPDERPSREVVLEALASKADLPAARPVLPSRLADRDAVRGQQHRGGGRQEEAVDAAGEARETASSEAEREQAKAARMEAKRAAASAREDARRAAEKMREEKVRRKPKPPRPGGGASP